MQAAVEHRGGGGRTPSSGRIDPRPSRAEHRQLQPAGPLGEVAERVGAGVPVGGGVGQRAGAAGVDHDHERAPHAVVTGRRRSERLTGENTAWSTAWNIAGGAYSSSTNSAPGRYTWTERTRRERPLIVLERVELDGAAVIDGDRRGADQHELRVLGPRRLEQLPRA